MVEDRLKGKRILYLSARTFNLEEQIKAKLESLGAEVIFYDERIKNSNWSKAVIRFNKHLVKRQIANYYRKILKETKHLHVDYMLVVRGEVVPKFFLKLFKEEHPEGILIFYNWDSFANTNNTAAFLDLYDRKLTFDPEDAKNFNISFRPLYFTGDYRRVKPVAKPKYDLLFLGTAHSDRYIISSKIKQFLEEHGRTMFCYYFMHSKWVYYFKKNFDKTFQYFDLKKLSFSSLNLSDIVTLYEQSNAILDINHPNQKGLTMRTFESIGSQRKLLTTNAEIKKFEFYNPNNIFVMDRDDCTIDIKFFDSPYQPIDEVMYEKLSIEGWIYNLFIDDEKEYWSKVIQ